MAMFKWAGAVLLLFSLIAGCGAKNAVAADRAPTQQEAVDALVAYFTDLFANDPSYNQGTPRDWVVTVDAVSLLPQNGYRTKWSNDLAYPVRAEVHIVGTQPGTGNRTKDDRGTSTGILFMLYHDSREGADSSVWSVEVIDDDGTVVPKAAVPPSH